MASKRAAVLGRFVGPFGRAKGLWQEAKTGGDLKCTQDSLVCCHFHVCSGSMMAIICKCHRYGVTPDGRMMFLIYTAPCSAILAEILQPKKSPHDDPTTQLEISLLKHKDHRATHDTRASQSICFCL